MQQEIDTLRRTRDNTPGANKKELDKHIKSLIKKKTPLEKKVRNKNEILSNASEYLKNLKRRQEYEQQPEVKEKRREYKQRPEAKERHREYEQQPDVKERHR
ncbi:MAG TPA: hypothetical protein QGF02_02810 [Candidatus Babeliales bacterium]|nr:hypothetical protein [Candidatus Babeliales bacterium]